jgi:hypothetical protein
MHTTPCASERQELDAAVQLRADDTQRGEDLNYPTLNHSVPNYSLPKKSRLEAEPSRASPVKKRIPSRRRFHPASGRILSESVSNNLKKKGPRAKSVSGSPSGAVGLHVVEDAHRFDIREKLLSKCLLCFIYGESTKHARNLTGGM